MKKDRLYEVLNTLNLNTLKSVSRTGKVGCPFGRAYDGPKLGSYNDELCNALCGIIYAGLWEGSQVTSCPCFLSSEYVVKEMFWEEVIEAKQGN